ncbi:MFS transporter [Chromobacterium vaccinii]|uniref:MFS transporter n=1 Tax=Chromobacterium vaccinii TaxID=1108595 RepID=UPI001E345E90|nr:MFS transporter [Chromobacterium vaccinii]
MYLIYLCYFAAEGIIYPFWPVWLKSQGFDNGGVALFMAAAYWPQVLFGLGLSYLADWRFRQLSVAGWVGMLSAIVIFLFYLPKSIALYLILAMLYGGLWTTVLPLSESYLLERDKSASHDYGWVRAAGSLSFIIFSIAGGQLLGLYGQGIVPGMIGLLMALTAAACFLLTVRHPHVGGARSVKVARPDWRDLRQYPVLLLCLGSAGLIQLSHCLYFATISNSWAKLGYSATWIGAFWAVAVLAEIVYFALSSKVMNLFSPLRVMMLSGLFATLRWVITWFDHSLTSIVVGQMMHALSFAAYHAALMRYIRDNAPESMRAFTQGIYYSLAVALPMGILTPLAGSLYDQIGDQAYLFMALISFSGVVTAFIANQHTGRSHESRILFRRLF